MRVDQARVGFWDCGYCVLWDLVQLALWETTTKKIRPEDPELEVKTRSKGFGNLKKID